MKSKTSMNSLVVGGIGGATIISEMERFLCQVNPRMVGVASAFITVRGIELLLSTLSQCGSPTGRLVAGIDHAITHPNALSLAKEVGWEVRIGRSSSGVFHPKLMVAGERFDRHGVLTKSTFFYIGSSNFTMAGLTHNAESAYISLDSKKASEAAQAFAAFWLQGIPLTEAILKDYSNKFAKSNRDRPTRILEELGINDTQKITQTSDVFSNNQQPPSKPTMENEFARVSWAGLESFTGEYAFQVEFPRASGAVIQGMIDQNLAPDLKVDVECADNKVRSMKFGFYQANSMFRLNIPNDVPGVDWARDHKEGAAIVSRGSTPRIPLKLHLLPPGDELDEIIGRSLALGTWGKTHTRLYGWF